MMDTARALTLSKPTSSGTTPPPTDGGESARPNENDLNILPGLSDPMNVGMSQVGIDSKSGPLIFNPHFTPTPRPERRKAIVDTASSHAPKPTTVRDRVADLIKKVNTKLAGPADRKSPQPLDVMARQAILSTESQHQQLRADFRAFCDSEFSTENIRFVQDVETFLDNPSAQLGQKIARESEDVNLGSTIKESLSSYTKCNPDAIGEDDLNKMIETLYEGQQGVIKMVTSDTLPRFLKAPKYAHHAR